MHDRDKIAKMKPVGPFAAPLPKSVDATDPEPMAVANDKQTIHGESFVATTAPMDSYDDDVARRYKQVPGSQIKPKSREETVAMQSPPGYTEPDENGWAKPTGQEEE
jgi:hypothetical protein